MEPVRARPVQPDRQMETKLLKEVWLANVLL